MKLKYGMFAEAGTVDSSGVFSLLRGGLTWIAADNFPAKCQHLTLLVCIEFGKHECDQTYDAVVKVESPTGDHLSPDQMVTMRPTIDPRFPGSEVTQFVGLYWYDGFMFQQPGRHKFTLSIQDSQIGEFTIQACQEPQK